jgi:hypothetical protein
LITYILLPASLQLGNLAIANSVVKRGLPARFQSVSDEVSERWKALSDAPGSRSVAKNLCDLCGLLFNFFFAALLLSIPLMPKRRSTHGSPAHGNPIASGCLNFVVLEARRLNF